MPHNQLLSLLSDGKFHSGQELATVLGVSRTAVWKQIHKLEELGIQIDSVHGKGYRLPHQVELLDQQQLQQLISGKALQHLSPIEIFYSLDSTNRYLLQQAQKAAQRGVCLAEQQTAGRGRRGRTWVSPFAHNVYLSLLWTFSGGAAQLEGLSLAVGVAIVKALEKCGAIDLKLKWPNDVLSQHKKLAGILLEMTGDASGLCSVVIGMGINIAMPQAQAEQIDQPWINLQQVIEQPLSRNEITARVLEELVWMLQTFEQQGFAAFREPWLAYDAFAEQTIAVDNGVKPAVGIAKGVDQRGALLLQTAAGLESFIGGEVSVRLT